MESARRFRPQDEILQTMPDLPLGDEFSSFDLSDLSNNESFTHFCSDEDDPPILKRPYISSIQNQSHKSLKKKLISKDGNRTSIMITETSCASRNTKNIQEHKAQIKLVKAKKRKIPSAKKSIRKFTVAGKTSIESPLLKEYWKKKSEVEEKYKNMIRDMDKEMTFEIELNVSKMKNRSNITNEDVNELSKIKEYYDDAKNLLNAQKLIEQEELLKEFKAKTGMPV